MSEDAVVLVTGSTGMVGSAFVQALRQSGQAVVGLARPSAASRMHESFDYPVLRLDLLDAPALRRALERFRPHTVIHMAAQAFNGTSWELESYTHLCNFNSTLNLLQACAEVIPGSRILLACSSAEYGCVDPAECPLCEDRALRPVSPYGVSKMATEALGFQYFSNLGMKVYLPRMFIHVGTGHPPATAIQNFARQVALIRKGRMPARMEVGRLDTARDFIDVRDGVFAMLTLLERGSPGVPVNICTGEALSIAEVLSMLCEVAGIEPEVVQVPHLMRPSDERLLLGNPERIRALGWERRFSMRETLGEVFRDWMERLD
jgi:GDP-4-dehydro-6-deoxy-D-mannose reductase